MPEKTTVKIPVTSDEDIDPDSFGDDSHEGYNTTFDHHRLVLVEKINLIQLCFKLSFLISFVVCYFPLLKLNLFSLPRVKYCKE